MRESLGVWMNGDLVGHWSVDRGASTFAYESSWLASDKVRPLSLSLPISRALTIRGQVVSNFFDNLLPDNERIRARLARRFRTKDTGAFSLLQAIGRDCVGAVQLLPEGTSPLGWNRIEAEPLTPSAIGRLLDTVPSDTAFENDHGNDELFRISVAGAQEKTALLRIGKRWYRPRGATPTTHIIKLPLGLIGGSRRIDISDSVENEWLCAQIVGKLGLPVARTSMASFAGRKALVVERFDRQWMNDGSWIARLPQEDFCQALGTAPDRKYEKDGGPGMNASLTLLAGSDNAASDAMTFQLTQLTFWLLGATDGHAKNFSVFLKQGGAYAMTPLYDIISVFPYLGAAPSRIQWRGAGLAMAMRAGNPHYAFYTIQPRHWKAMAMRHGGASVWHAMLDLVSGTDAAMAGVEKILPAGFPAVIRDRVFQGIKDQAALFLRGIPD